MENYSLVFIAITCSIQILCAFNFNDVLFSYVAQSIRQIVRFEKGVIFCAAH